jgi:CARDB
VSTRDDDTIDIDFFDEGATRETAPGEAAVRRPAPPEGGGRPRPRLRPTGGLTPLLRLIGLIAFAILVVVLVVVWAQGCASDRERDSYDGFMGDVGTIGAGSARIGNDLAELLTTPGLKQDELETRLAGLVQQQRLDTTRARELDPPGPLHPSHEAAIEALEFRTSGIQGLLAAFQATKTSKDATAAGEQLALQGQRLVTSDVVWDDRFRGPAEVVLEEKEINGVAVPDSNFVENPDLFGARSMSAIWQRVHGASTGGTASGLHGNSLEYVRVQPSGQQLSTEAETTIQTSTDLLFEVAVTNSGDFQEVGVEVKLTVPAQTPIVKTAKIDLIDSGETKTVQFQDFGEAPIGEQLQLKVEVTPVKGERNTANNTAEYPIIFSLAAP